MLGYEIIKIAGSHWINSWNCPLHVACTQELSCACCMYGSTPVHAACTQECKTNAQCSRKSERLDEGRAACCVAFDNQEGVHVRDLLVQWHGLGVCAWELIAKGISLFQGFEGVARRTPVVRRCCRLRGRCVNRRRDRGRRCWHIVCGRYGARNRWI
jgi:hypothetical protein